MKLRLLDVGGEFCTRRNSPSLPPLIKTLESAIEANTGVEIDRDGVKILTPSFIDELIPPLMVKYGEDVVNKLIKFTPPLDGFLKDQLARGLRARSAKR